MTVCKQPVATLALNATSSYVVMIHEWGRPLPKGFPVEPGMTRIIGYVLF
ncbi:MAG: hypothetical protein J5534_15300 [Fibrobacter sp.]|nr:hypothetical protein [Fibrobacter sp.]